MGLNDIYDETVAQSLKTDYTKTSSQEISIFETTIRHVGGLLSSYELGGRKEKKLVEQARVVGDKLMYGWINNNDIPFNTLKFWSGLPTPKTDESAVIAETGTLILEFDRLSTYTGNNTYRDFAIKAELATINTTPLPFPGLNPQRLNQTTGKPVGDYVTWGGGSDSFFEYLNKYALMIGTQETYFPAWITSVKSSILHLITTAGGTKKKLTYLADYSAKNGGTLPRGSHLECFVGGNWLLGGKLLGNDDIFNYGLDLAESCIHTYTASATGVGPEGFIYRLANGSSQGIEIQNPEFYAENGFDYSSKPYVLRPEVMESVFYAYRLTGDSKWQDLAWQAFQALEKYCGTDTAFTSLEDVSNSTTAQIDLSESFLYAELFKYSYLVFTDGDVLDLGKYVFNTEAHPFEIDNLDVDFTGLNPGSIKAPAAHVTTDGEEVSATKLSETSSGKKAKTSGYGKLVPAPLFTGVNLEKLAGVTRDQKPFQAAAPKARLAPTES
jgi:mannosyl-oligosaccharide alpha-1,2-mannosidase